MRRAICSLALGLFFSSGHADAQCGARVSTCRQCHEIDKQGPVLGDGKPWHKDHAFGDFCATCHGGDDAAKDTAAAHDELMDPLAHPALSCGTAMCHGSKAAALAATYRRARAPAPAARPPAPPAAPTPAPAPPGDHNAFAGAVALGLAIAGGAYVRWNERRRRAAKAPL